MTTNKTSINAMQILIILLMLFTAAVHLMLGVRYYDPLFVLNGLGYLALVGALFLPIPIIRDYRNVWRWLLVAYAAVSIIMYFYINRLGVDAIGLACKAAEAAIIVLVILGGRRLFVSEQ